MVTTIASGSFYCYASAAGSATTDAAMDVATGSTTDLTMDVTADSIMGATTVVITGFSTATTMPGYVRNYNRPGG